MPAKLDQDARPDEKLLKLYSLLLFTGKEYSLNAVAKRIDSRESDLIDKETIVNAVSTQLSVDFGSGNRCQKERQRELLQPKKAIYI